MKLTHMDLFTGYGGFTLAMRANGVETIGFSEIEPDCIAVLKKNFPEVKNYGSVKSVSGKRIKADIVTFGSPCQDISLSGQRRGLSGSRSGLFYQAVRILDEMHPSYFIFENVEGLLSSNDGKDFVCVLRSFADIGYDAQWQVVNSAGFSTPQSRERIFIVGHLGTISRPEIFPIGESNDIPAQKGQQRPASSLTSTMHKGVGNDGCTLVQVGNVDTAGNNSIWGRVYDPKGVATTLTSGGGGLGAKTGLYVVPGPKIKKTRYGRHQQDAIFETEDAISPALQSGGDGHIGGGSAGYLKFKVKKVGNLYPSGGENGDILDPSGICKTIKSGETDNPNSGGVGSCNSPKIMVAKPVMTTERRVKNQGGRTTKEDGEPTYAITSCGRQGVDNDKAIRRLTPRECERLMGLPDDWTRSGIVKGKEKMLSDTARYKMIGNGVVINVVREIVRKLVKSVEQGRSV